MSRLSAALLVVGLGCAGGQTAELRGPVIGFIYDAPSQSLKQVVGFPGSAYLGPSALANVEKAFIAPDGDSALTINKEGAALVLGLRGGDLRMCALPGMRDDVSHVSWSSDSARLVAYSLSTRRLQRIALNTAGDPTITALDLSSIEGDVVRVATNRDGLQTVVAVRHREWGGLYAVTESGSIWKMEAIADPGALVFSPLRNELYAVDRTTGGTVLFPEGIYGGAEVLAFSGESERLLDPVGAALSRDGQNLYIAGGSDRSIAEYDLVSRTLRERIPLQFIPEHVERLDAAGSVLALTGRQRADATLWLLDIRRTPTVYFVPAGE